MRKLSPEHFYIPCVRDQGEHLKLFCYLYESGMISEGTTSFRPILRRTLCPDCCKKLEYQR